MKELNENTIKEIRRFMEVWQEAIKEGKDEFQELQISEYAQFLNKWNDTFLEFVRMADNTEEELEELEEININNYIEWYK